jgi:hypothetical protein
MTNVERVTLHRKRKKLGQRAVTVILSQQEIDFLLAHAYELFHCRSYRCCKGHSTLARAVISRLLLEQTTSRSAIRRASEMSSRRRHAQRVVRED